MKRILISITCLIAAFGQVLAQNASFIGQKQIYYGAAYYPEVWPEQEIDKDIARMKELNMNVMRMAEFSWSTMEPQEGKYNFGWLHKVIDKLNGSGIATILGTPSATPPMWLIEKHPEIMQVDHSGYVHRPGIRRDVSYSSAIYREYCRKITEAMAKEFGNKPGVIGWQTDNEFSLTPDYSAETLKLWQQWLARKYGSIENLNKALYLPLWSQSFNSFAQVYAPNLTMWHHPGLKWNWTAFTNDMMVDFQQVQVNAIKKYSKAPITHDGMPGQNVDYEKLFKPLDFLAINNYHSFEAYDLIMSNYDRMRGFNKGYHWLFETAPNFSGGGNNGSTWFLHQPDGSMRAAIWMNYALGAQGTMFWLWRQHPAGQEVTHGAVVSAWGKPAANYNDLKVLGAELKKTSEYLINQPVAPAEVAVYYSNESKAALDQEKFANDFNHYQDWTYRSYVPVALKAYLHRDVIYPSSPVDGYKVLYLPYMPYVSDELRARLKPWVEKGGTLILGPLSAYRNNDYSGYTDAYLGDIEKWAGISVESWVPIGVKPRDAEYPINLRFDASLSLSDARAYLLGQSLNSTKGKVLARYTYGMHKDLPAIIENEVGKGKVVVLGTDPGKDAIAKLLLKYADEKGIKPLASGDEGVVLVPRSGKKPGIVIVNISKDPKTINYQGKEGTDLLSGTSTLPGVLSLKPYEVRLLQFK